MASGIGGSEEKFLETFFQLISQFAFDKAKDLSDKERENIKQKFGSRDDVKFLFGSKDSIKPTFGSKDSIKPGSAWALLVYCLGHFSMAEKTYVSLGFLEQKGFFTRSKDTLKSLYQTLMVEFRRVEDTADQNEQLLAHLSEHLSHFLTARLKTMEFYEQVSTMGTLKFMNYSDLVIVITEIVQSYSKSFHHPLLAPLKAAFGFECDIILHLIQAQILMSDWKFLGSLMQLYEAHTKLVMWGAIAQLKESKKSTFSSSSKHSGWPALYLWLTKYKGFLLSKFSLYFYDVLQKQTTPIEMKGLKAPEDLVSKLISFQKKSDAHMVTLVLDIQGLGNSFTGPGYSLPGKTHPSPQGLDSFPSIFSYPHTVS